MRIMLFLQPEGGPLDITEVLNLLFNVSKLSKFKILSRETTCCIRHYFYEITGFTLILLLKSRRHTQTHYNKCFPCPV